MLRAQIYEDLKTAMKAQDRLRLDVVRYIWSEIKRIEIDAKHELADVEIVELLRKEMKKRIEAVDQMRHSGRTDIIEHEEKQLAIMQQYVPEMMSREEIGEVVKEVTASLPQASAQDFGKIMGMVMSQLKGKADGRMVQEVVKEKLI